MKERIHQFSFSKLVFNNLSFYRTANLWVFAAVMLAAMVITGALFVGDSVKFTLKKRADERLGWISSAIFSSDRWFTTNMVGEFKTTLRKESQMQPSQIRVAFGIKLDGSVATPDETARANRVNIYGVNEDFWDDTGREKFNSLPPKHVLVNKALAEQLKANIGDELIVRVKKPALLSFELPVSLQENAYVGMRVKVHGIVSGKEMGNFSMRANQLPPLNLFMRYNEIASSIEKTGRANLLLCNLDSWISSGSQFDRALSSSITPEDCGIELRSPYKGVAELRSERVFIERHVYEKAIELVNSDRWKDVFETNATHILTYLVNLFSRNGKQTPYSIIAAADEPLVDKNITEDEIIINRWLADDLEARVGDVIRLQYYLPESGGKLVEMTNYFKVAKIVEHVLPWFDRTLLPDIPGLAKAESTQDWNLGFPLVHKFRKKDDDYWRDYRGTPKAFISLSAGKKLWANRFGELTAIRFKIKDDNILKDEKTMGTVLRQFAEDLSRSCGVASFGFQFEPIRVHSMESVENSQDFGGLFLGFSFFLVISALMLVALLFNLNIEGRFREFGIYMAVGFTPKDIAKLLFCEVFAIIIVGALVGGVLGVLYSKIMLHFLSTSWKEAAGGVEWEFFASPMSFSIGIFAAILCSLFAIFGTVHRLKKATVKDIFSQMRNIKGDTSETRKPCVAKDALKLMIPFLPIVTGIAIAIYLIVTGQYASAGGFFMSGILLLSGGIILLPTMLKFLGEMRFSYLNLTGLSLRSASRNIKRTVLTAGMFASGFFILLSVSVFKLDAGKGAKSLTSGTGGFDLIAESSIPIFKDLNTEEGLNHYGLDRSALGNVHFVSFRVKEGDEASCLNLNRAIRPRLLACDWKLLVGRFSFSMYDRNLRPSSNWELLGQIITNKTDNKAEIIVPAIGDAASIQWAMGKKLGDTIDYTDGFGRPFKIKIVGGVANSILQGNLVIGEDAFRKLFPDNSGYQFFLIDCKDSNPIEVSKTLSRAFSDYGMEIVSARQRLSQFNAVQNTYIGAFQILGGLGLLLGSAGIAIILVRNVLERRNELAVMVAVGFPEKTVRNMIVIEHAFVIFAGLLLGIAPAAISILPAVLGETSQFSFVFAAVLIISSAVMGFLWTNLASKFVFKTRLVEALRIE